MTNLEDLFKRLKAHSDFNKNENDEKFLEILDEISLLKDRRSVSFLLEYLDDNERDYSWILQSICHSMEYLDKEIYMIELLKNLHIAFDKGKEWLVELLFRIINHEDCLRILYKNLYLSNKNQFLELLDIMESEFNDHNSVIQELKAKLQLQG